MHYCRYHHRIPTLALKVGLWVVIAAGCWGEGIRSVDASLILPEVSASSAQILNAIEHSSTATGDFVSSFGEGMASQNATTAGKALVSSRELSPFFNGVLFGKSQQTEVAARSCQSESSSNAPTNSSGPSVSSAILTPNSELVNLEPLSFWKHGRFINVPAPPTSELLRPPQPC